GITQTVRNYGASLGLAVLGTVLVTAFRSQLNSTLQGQGLPPSRATPLANSIAQHTNRATGSGTSHIPHFIRLDFAYATRTVFFIMAGVMAVAGLIALVGLRAGVQEENVRTD